MTVAAFEAAPAEGALFERTITARPRPRGAGPRSRARQPLPPPERPRPRSRQDTFGQVRRAAPTTRIHRGKYQGIILAEFVAAVLLVAATPFADKKATSISPYGGKDLMQLGAITVLYFVLALVSTAGGEVARVSAWLGGLVLLTVGLGEAAHLAQVIDLAGIGTTKGSSNA